jgi:hypothetical protein
MVLYGYHLYFVLSQCPSNAYGTSDTGCICKPGMYAVDLRSDPWDPTDSPGLSQSSSMTGANNGSCFAILTCGFANADDDTAPGVNVYNRDLVQADNGPANDNQVSVGMHVCVSHGLSSYLTFI